MLKRATTRHFATGTICATGTLRANHSSLHCIGLAGRCAFQRLSAAQRNMGIYSPDTVSVGDLFVGAMVPGLVLVMLYILYIWLVAHFSPEKAPD